MMDSRGPELRVQTAHRLRHARPAMIGGPTHRLRAHAVPLTTIAEQLLETAGQRFRVTLGHEMAGHAVLDPGGASADARRDHGAPAGHRLERDHAEGLIVRRHDRRFGGSVEETEATLWLGSEKATEALAG